MKRVICGLFMFLLGIANFASAENIRGINIDFVNIDHAGNVADTQVMQYEGTTGYGAVGYNYRIGKYEVTNAQWNTFVAAAGAPTGTDGHYAISSYSIGDEQPTNNVSWYEAAQFCNYLTSGDKSKGAYQFSGNNSNPGSFLCINRAAAISSYGIAYVIPTENEWYKAAYSKPDGSGYSLYANGADVTPVASLESNYGNYIGATWNVGSGTQEQNGTFDMMGNVSEWNEALVYNSPERGLRGGSRLDQYPSLASDWRSSGSPLSEFDGIGFRVASVPEPATLLVLGLGGLMLKRRTK